MKPLGVDKITVGVKVHERTSGYFIAEALRRLAEEIRLQDHVYLQEELVYFERDFTQPSDDPSS